MTKFASAKAAGLALAVTLTGSAAWAGASDVAAINALEGRFQRAVQAKDLNAVMSVYAPDVLVFDAVPPRQYASAAAYRKDWQGVLGSFKGPIRFTIADLHVAAGADMAYSHSIQTIAGTDAKNGKPLSLTVRLTDVYRKTGAGWKVVHEHASFPVDLDTGKPDLQSKP